MKKRFGFYENINILICICQITLFKGIIWEYRVGNDFSTPLHSLNYKHIRKSTHIASKYHHCRPSVPNFRSVSLLVWPGDVTQTNTYIHKHTHIQVNLRISSVAARLTWILIKSVILIKIRPLFTWYITTFNPLFTEIQRLLKTTDKPSNNVYQ